MEETVTIPVAELNQLIDDNEKLVEYFKTVGGMLGLFDQSRKGIRGIAKAVQKVILNPEKYERATLDIVPVIERYMNKEKAITNG